MKKLLALLIGAASLLVTPAYADFTGKNAALATVTFKNPGDCTSVVCTPVFQLYNGTNVVSLSTAGADGVSNTLNGLPTYARMLQFNGTTWDRWQGAIKAAPNAYAAGSLAIGAGVDGWDITQGTTSDAVATAGGTGTVSAKLRLVTTQLNATNIALGAPFQAGGTVGQLPYPIGAVPLTASATGTTGATTATLAGAVAKTTYICSLSVRANATANTNVTDTVTGVITGTLSRALWVPANTAGLGVDEQIYSPCVPASGTNQAIAVVSGAPGTGGVVTVNATGYQL